jgi:hypothetical protein
MAEYKVTVDKEVWSVVFGLGPSSASCSTGSLNGVTVRKQVGHMYDYPQSHETLTRIFNAWWDSEYSLGYGDAKAKVKDSFKCPYFIVGVADYWKAGKASGIYTADFIAWLIERGDIVVSSPLFSNPSYHNGHLCIAAFWVPPNMTGRLVDGTGGLYNLPEQFEKKIWTVHTTLKDKPWDAVMGAKPGAAKHFAMAKVFWEENHKLVEAKKAEPVVWKAKKNN